MQNTQEESLHWPVPWSYAQQRQTWTEAQTMIIEFHFTGTVVCEETRFRWWRQRLNAAVLGGMGETGWLYHALNSGSGFGRSMLWGKIRWSTEGLTGLFSFRGGPSSDFFSSHIWMFPNINIAIKTFWGSSGNTFKKRNNTWLYKYLWKNYFTHDFTMEGW